MSSLDYLVTWLPGGQALHLYPSVILACFIIGLSSMISLFIFSVFIHRNNPFSLTDSTSKTDFDDPNKSEILKLVLSFAVGGLLGDVFLHLIPEASVQLSKVGYNAIEVQQFIGFWILVGLLLFVTMESVFNTVTNQSHCDKDEKKFDANILDDTQDALKSSLSNGNLKHRKSSLNNGHLNTYIYNKSDTPRVQNSVDITGYLNLLANGFDNFTHGVSVGASFLVSIKMGILTTLAIAIHEIPHEIADYVILIRSGFSCWNAFRAQLSISLITILGSVTVIYLDSASSTDSLSYTLWILPLTAGGFLYISLTSLLPELLVVTAEQNCFNKMNQLVRLFKRLSFTLLGIIIMATINTIDVF